jgi:protein-S-isoprenylcysteine O-methyltransferase Ste14
MSEFAEHQPASIAHAAVVETAQPVERPRSFRDWLLDPRVDKILAIVAVAPFAYPLALHFRHDLLAWKVIYLAQTLTLIATMAIRRPAVRISASAMDWAVAFLASYWGLLVLSVAQVGRPLTTSRLVLALYPLAVIIEIWGRLSLGRNIGLLPAQRKIVVRGAYRWVRHPIYTALFLTVMAGALRSYSPRNVILLAAAVALCVARTLMEEDFLRKDAEYAAYMKRVRWRWIPGVI